MGHVLMENRHDLVGHVDLIVRDRHQRLLADAFG
jgi:hypothetical protein